MKEHAALVIAALMITSMALSISTTSVSAAESTATISPETVKGSTRVLLTITITNQTSENIENILIRAPAGSFSEAIGGLYTIENLKLAADNLENAVVPLQQAGENLRIAAENKKATKPYVENFGREIYEAGTDFGVVTPITATNTDGGTTAETTDYAYVRDRLHEVKTYTDIAAAGLGTEPQNLTSIADNLRYAGSRIRVAGDNFGVDNTIDTTGTAGKIQENRQEAFENLKDAGAKIENAAENYLASGNFGIAADLLEIAADNISNAKTKLTNDSDEDAINAAADLGEAKSFLDDVIAKLDAAGDRLNNAGTALGVAENYLTSAGSLIVSADNVNLLVAGDNLENAALMLEAAENQLIAPENFLAAGDNLVSAAAYMASSASALGAVLGGSGMTDAQADIDVAGDNLNNNQAVNMTVAGTALVDAASDLSAAASKMLSTASSMKPANWTLTEPAATGWGTENILFSALNENYRIAPGAESDFSFVWKSPADGTYTLKIWGYKPGATLGTPTFGPLEVTIAVDGTAPKVTKIEVTQAGVAIPNLVGNTYDNGKATVTITFSEKLSAIGDVLVKDVDNFLPPLTVSTTDNITYTATFTVGEWDENVTTIVVKKATDLAGNENGNLDNQRFWVDTRPPVILESGISALLNQMAGGQKVQAGTGLVYWVDNKTAQTISGNIEDNCWTGARLGYENSDPAVISLVLKLDDVTLAVARPTPPTPDNSFSKGFDLPEGKTSVFSVVLTDWTGNTTENKVENIFIDTEKPEIKFGKITGKDYTKDLVDGVPVNDNTPTITLTITDPGYPDTGLGVWYENLVVYLDNDENALNGGLFPLEIENADAWDPITGLFENIIDNAQPDDTYYITVVASDNLNENVTASVKFVIDTVAPAISSTPTETTIKMGTSANPTVTNKDTLKITGDAESGATVEVLVNGEVKKTTVTVGSPWSATVPLEEGTNKIQARAIDAAGNENMVTYGYLISDTVAPSITIDEPSEGAVLGSKSVTVSGSVSDVTTAVSKLTVDGITVPVAENGSFTTSVSVAEGTRTIAVSATDEAGNTEVSSVSVTVDATRPIAEITAPETGLLTAKGSVTVQGKAYDEVTSVVEATLNGEPVSLKADGTFSKSVSLSLGTNTITLSVKDKAGHYATDSITIVSDTQAPSVSITAPEEGTITDQESITVMGKVTDEPPETSVTVRVNAGGTSQEIALEKDGSFVTTVVLPEGTSTITVSAVDEANNVGLASVTVERTVTPWMTYAAIILVIIALVLAAIAIFWKR